MNAIISGRDPVVNKISALLPEIDTLFRLSFLPVFWSVTDGQVALAGLLDARTLAMTPLD